MKFYITTTLPYVNSDPHIGFAMEIIEADFIARYHRLIGDEVIFNTGTDEHGQKIYDKALETGQTPQAYTDFYAAKFDVLKDQLNLTYDKFIRTTDPKHKMAAQEFWRRCLANGDIYKAKYAVKYCIGCELEKTDSELVDGKCPLHPTYEIQLQQEENYYFRFSAYQDKLLALYKHRPDFILPEWRLNEISKFVSDGLKDFSISRLKEKMSWGVEVPNDSQHVMYVWFDALVNYISTLGWPDKNSEFGDFWPGIQIAGTDNLRQQSAMWQAMLMSAGIEPSKQIIIHGFVLDAEGRKMSKSLGNVIDPIDLVAKFGTEVFRFYVAKELNTYDETPVSIDRLKASYTSDLANGLGNLVARVAKLCEKNEISVDVSTHEFYPEVKQVFNDFKFNEGLNFIWTKIAEADKLVSEAKPWELDPEAAKPILLDLVSRIQTIAHNLQPFMPETAEKILNQFSGQIKSTDPLFPRIITE